MGPGVAPNKTPCWDPAGCQFSQADAKAKSKKKQAVDTAAKDEPDEEPPEAEEEKLEGLMAQLAEHPVLKSLIDNWDIVPDEEGLPSISMEFKLSNNTYFHRWDWPTQVPLVDDVFSIIGIMKMPITIDLDPTATKVLADTWVQVSEGSHEVPVNLQKKLGSEYNLLSVFPLEVSSLFKGWGFVKQVIKAAHEDDDSWTVNHKEALDNLVAAKVNYQSHGHEWVPLPNCHCLFLACCRHVELVLALFC